METAEVVVVGAGFAGADIFHAGKPERAQRMLTEQMASLKALADALWEKEVLDTLEIDQIIGRSSAPTVPA